MITLQVIPAGGYKVSVLRNPEESGGLFLWVEKVIAFAVSSEVKSIDHSVQVGDAKMVTLEQEARHDEQHLRYFYIDESMRISNCSGALVSIGHNDLVGALMAVCAIVKEENSKIFSSVSFSLGSYDASYRLDFDKDTSNEKS